MKKIFYLEPYVYKQIDAHEFILYNTLNGKHILKNNNSEFDLIKRINEKGFVALTDNDLCNKILKKFISHLRKNYFAEIKESKEEKHFQFSPSIYVNYIDYVNNNKQNILDYINVLTLYINGICNQTCSICTQAFKQIPFCSKMGDKKLMYADIKNVISEFSPDFLLKININGGNIVLHEEWENIVSFFNKQPAKKTYSIFHENIDAFSVKKLSFIESQNSTIRILFSEIPTEKRMQEIHLCLEKTKIPLIFSIVLRNEKDIHLINILNMKSYQVELSPLYTSNNNTFFKKNIFLSKKEMLYNTKLTYKEILEKEVLNLHLMGKAYILNNGNFFANLNSDCLGNISDGIGELTQTLIGQKKDVWFLTRKHVSPCNKCVYRIFCPPISNYELFAQKYDMCKIKKS